MLTSTNYINVQRNKLNYEVLAVSRVNNSLYIDGWATMPSTQNFTSKSSHAYQLELKSKNDLININGKLTNQDLTKQMEYRGNPKCSSSSTNNINCNYDHKNVGFRFEVNLNQLKTNENYQAYLKMNAKQAKTNYRIPLFYVKEGATNISYNGRQYLINSDFKHTKLQVYSSALVARSGPSPLTAPIEIGKSCSSAHGNTGFLLQNAQFNHIKDVNIYNKQITYFKVRVGAYGCVNQRMRVVESTSSNRYTHIPSTHTNYIGEPMTIRVRQIESKPVLTSENIEIMQYSTYDPYFKVFASDTHDGNITSKITLKSNTVNTRIPGEYQTCYTVTNTFNNTAQSCRFVKVIPIPSKRRFISKYTAHNTRLSRWNRKDIKERLQRDDNVRILEFYKP